jgi:hypothetical protein
MKCGVRLSEAQTKCPLCGFEIPESAQSGKKGLYPKGKSSRIKEDFKAAIFFFTVLFLALGGAVLAADLVLGGGLCFSPFVLLSLLLFYSIFLLPRWFYRPNPVIFVPIAFFCFLLFLWYFDFYFKGGWFFPFALPSASAFLLILEAAVTLIRYLKSGKLYIFGGFFLALGLLCMASEFLFRGVFSLPIALTWSLLPLVFFCSIGLALIVIAIVPSFRHYVERRFFV